MNALRHICGLVITAIGCLLLLGVLVALMDPTIELPLSQTTVMLVCMGILPTIGGVRLLRRSFVAPKLRCCPECGCAERAAAGLLQKRHSVWLTRLGGILLSGLWAASREQQVRCIECDHLYFTETRGSRIAAACLWVFVLLWFFSVVIGMIPEQSGGHR